MMLHLEKTAAFAAIFCLVTVSTLRAEQKTPARLANVPQADQQKPVDPLDAQIDMAIELTSRRQLTAGVHTPWQIMHGVLALRHDFRLKKSHDSQPDETIKAIDWMGSGAMHDGLTLFERTQFGGQARPFTVPYAFEGHVNQFFGLFTMSDLPTDHKFKAGPDEVSIADMIENAKMEVAEGPEITWTLWALSHYLPTDAEWRNKLGEVWSIERLVRMQTRQSVISAPCGGTHGLFALAYSRNKHLVSGGKLRGVWLESDQKLQRFIEEARVLQNRDGSFSTEYFRGRGQSDEFNKRIAHSGHMLEWLMMALPQSRLKEQWVRYGLSRLANDLIENRKTAAECGPLYHSLHALILYRLRTRPELYGPGQPTLMVKADKQAKADATSTAETKAVEKKADKKTVKADKQQPVDSAEKVAEEKPEPAVIVTPVAAESDGTEKAEKAEATTEEPAVKAEEPKVEKKEQKTESAEKAPAVEAAE